MRALHEGQWREVSRIYVGQNGSLREASVLGDEQLVAVPSVTLTVAAGTNFSPWVELTYPNGADGADIYWYVDGETTPSAVGQKPALGSSTAVRSIEFRAVAADGSSAMDRVVTINCGFNMYEDSGRYNLGAVYNWDPQPLINIVDLQNVPNLVRFCAAHAAFVAGSVLDFTGLSKLEYIECYIADVRNVILTGCTSLIRLCLEQTMITELDLNPVRHSLRDLRSAAQRVASLTFTALEGPMEALYHYCIRDQVAINIYSFANLPVIEEFWAWNTHQSVAVDQPISTVARSFPLNGNTYNQASVDNILIGLADNSSAGSYSTVELSGSAAPSSTGLAAARTLVARGWTVTVTGGIPPEEALPEPIAEYGFNEGSGTTAVDSSGNNHTATQINAGGTLAWVAGKNGGSAISQDGIDGWGAFGWQPPSPIALSSFSYMAWVHLDGVSVWRESGIWMSTNGSSGWDNVSSLCGLRWNSGFGWAKVTAFGYEYEPPSPTYTDDWAHLAFTFDPTSGVVAYWNGIQVATIPLSSLTIPSTYYLERLGLARGINDEVRFFDTALTAEQITTYMNTPVE